MSLRTASFVIGSIDLLLSCVLTVFVFPIIGVIVSLLLMIGAYTKIRHYMLPWFIVNSFLVIFTGFLFVLTLFAAVTGVQRIPDVIAKKGWTTEWIGLDVLAALIVSGTLVLFIVCAIRLNAVFCYMRALSEATECDKEQNMIINDFESNLHSV